MQNLKLAKIALNETKNEHREINTTTIHLSDSMFKKIKQRIVKFQNEIAQLSMNDKDENMVYQLNFQFFPVSIQVKK